MYFNQIWDSDYNYVEPFETNPKNQILAKFDQNVGLIWPNFGQIVKNIKLVLFCIRKWYFQNVTHFEAPRWHLKHLADIWREAHLATWPNGQIWAKKCQILNITLSGTKYGDNDFFKFWPKFDQIWPRLRPNLSKIWFLGLLSKGST